MTKLPEPFDIFAPVPASYPFEEQLEDGKARIEAQQAEAPLAVPFAETLGSTTHEGPAPTATSEETKTRSSKGSKG